MRPKLRACIGLASVLLLSCGGGGGGGGDGGGLAPFNLPSSIVAGDFNSDGLQDLAVATTFVSSAPPHSGFVAVVLQRPSAAGTFAPGVHYATGSDPQMVVAADLDGDGRLDLVVANSSAGSVSIFIQDHANPGTFLPPVVVPVGGHPNGLAVGDLNGDGKPDIVVATVSSNLAVLIQNPAGPPGSFLPPAPVAVGKSAIAVAIGDVNGDGKQDLVVLTQDNNGNGDVAVLLQDAAHPGSFLPPTEFAAGAQPAALKLADVNGDHLLDIIVANQGTPSNPDTASVSVLLQDPAHPGSFLAPTNYPTGARSLDVAVGDLNGDGKPDLVVANAGALSTTGSVSVLLQDPGRPGVFLPAVNYAGVVEPLSVAIADLNGDGKPDIAVADGDIATILFQQPGAPGKFLPPVKVGS
ncbi:VCBS repeat-containing protein [Burkholderia sp. Ac-20353]|uniref:FG-GAP repeat domain-containing protein n=1 Tax=Burkholderia sp. Ac-20353 TaxID=2703894 RepID=UPI00197BC470|nr:VCBS repeat-containing protein [Burkholderia sp. Ac-20353]MBN3788018.1 VCBS repeat-containing protein [Burkholderia sp. Ac-20353]